MHWSFKESEEIILNSEILSRLDKVEEENNFSTALVAR